LGYRVPRTHNQVRRRTQLKIVTQHVSVTINNKLKRSIMRCVYERRSQHDDTHCLVSLPCVVFLKATDVPGSTALMAAAWRGDLEATKLLVHLKANPNIVRCVRSQCIIVVSPHPTHTSLRCLWMPNSTIATMSVLCTVLWLGTTRKLWSGC